MVRGERLIKFGNIWFSAKSIEVERYSFYYRGRALFDWWWIALVYTEIEKTSNTIISFYSSQISGVKVINQEGNSPDYSLRSLNYF